MYPTRDSITSNNGWLWCLSILIFQHLIAASRPDLTLEEPSGNDIQQGDLKATREEPSHQASLMAGNRTPGPSDVPCLVETSTAHGELLLWITPSSIASNKLLWSSSYVLNLFQKPPLPSPELSASLQISHPPPYGRRSAICVMPTKEKLGFPLVGSSKNGPITLLKPKSKRCNPKQILSKPRSVPNVSSSIFSHMLRRLWEKIDRRHQSNRNLPLLSWMFKKSMRTLPLDSPRSISYESKRLKKNDLRLIDYPLKQLEIVSIQWSQPEVVLSSLFLLQPSRTRFNYSQNTPRIKSRTALLPDLKGLRRPSSPIVERTSAPPSSFMERNRSNSLVAPLGLVFEAKDPFQTSQHLLIVAIPKFPEMFVEVSSTHHNLACGMLLASFCLRDSMDLSSKLYVYLTYLLYVVSLCSKTLYHVFPLFGLIE